MFRNRRFIRVFTGRGLRFSLCANRRVGCQSLWGMRFDFWRIGLGLRHGRLWLRGRGAAEHEGRGLGFRLRFRGGRGPARARKDQRHILLRLRLRFRFWRGGRFRLGRRVFIGFRVSRDRVGRLGVRKRFGVRGGL
ncbi:hypothetical protein CKO11_11335 [Rhodobacter sp. TJ_12]|nr:hypothetical protein [Rhodobacter sp. TJ_12]